MSYQGDYVEDYATLNFKFQSRATTAIPTILTGTPVISVYKANGATQSTAGITLTTEFDGIVGSNHVLIDLSSDAFYAVGNDYQILITAGTVGGVSVVGAVVATFSIENRFEEITTAAFEARTLVAANYFDPAADAVANVTLTATTTNVTNQVTANVTAISGDTTAADNLELMYDGTGYIDDTAPSSRSQVASIAATGGGAVNFNADADNTGGAIKGVSFVGVQTLTFADTKTLNDVFHLIDDTTNEIDIVYQLDVTAVNTSTQIVWDGFLNSNNDVLNIMAYDFEGAAFEQIGSVVGQNGTSNVQIQVPLFPRHTGTSGADTGLVFIRFQGTAQSNPSLSTDRLFVSAVSNITTLGFEGGAVWMDSATSNSGTAAGIGFVDKAVNNIADAKTIAQANSLKTINLLPGSSDTLASAFDQFEFTGRGYSIDFGSQTCVQGRFNNGLFTGILSGATGPLLRECRVTNVTIPPITALLNGAMGGTINLNGVGVWNISGNEQAFEAATIIDFSSAGTKTLRLFDNEGEIEVQNMVANDIIIMTGDGQMTLNANCTGGTLRIYGVIELIDNSGGAVTILQTARLDNDTINAEVDTAISDASLATAANLATVDTVVDAILVDTGTTLPASIAALNDITAADVLAAGDIDGFTLEEAQKIGLAALGGKLSGAATSTNTIRAADDSKARITATVDADGNRTAVTLDGSG